jgi:hypothetical protein
VFHLELKQFPNVARAFNLTEEQQSRQFLVPWAAGRLIEWDERRWEPAKVKLTIVEGPELPRDQMGMGRGWTTVVKAGTDVTARILEQARQVSARDPLLDLLKEQIVARLAAAPLALNEAVALADDVNPGRRVSERLALAELAVWELLHQGGARLVDGDGAVAPERWERTLFDWSSWSASAVQLEAPQNVA